jgi:hypothetical protein
MKDSDIEKLIGQGQENIIRGQLEHPFTTPFAGSNEDPELEADVEGDTNDEKIAKVKDELKAIPEDEKVILENKLDDIPHFQFDSGQTFAEKIRHINDLVVLQGIKRAREEALDTYIKLIQGGKRNGLSENSPRIKTLEALRNDQSEAYNMVLERIDAIKPKGLFKRWFGKNK